jgi:DNA polymerase-4
MRTILHIDMNAFFASVEQRADPALRGKAMAVIGSEHRGVILSPSYEARVYGVKTGMMYWEARQKCPEIILVPAESAKYSCACERLIEIWKAFTPLAELFSIDEAFLDVTGCDALFGDPVRIAIQIKERIWHETGLTCSIGIASNKLLAKLGSDLQKPDGLVLISPDDVSDVLENLPVKELCGIGPNFSRHLAAMGIHTCGELGRAPLRQLISRFGILQLSEKVGRRLRRGLYGGRTVSLIIRYADFHTFSKQRRLRHAVNHGLDIYAAALGLLRETRLLQPVRLVGVSVSNLDRRIVEIPLFVDERKRKFVAEAMDEINDRYGEFTVTWGTLAERHRHGRIISPAWRPTGDRQY